MKSTLFVQVLFVSIYLCAPFQLQRFKQRSTENAAAAMVVTQCSARPTLPLKTRMLVLTKSSLIEDAAASSDYNGAVTLFDSELNKSTRLDSFTVDTLNSVIKSLGRIGQYDRAAHVFKRMRTERNPKPNEATYVKAANACASAKEWQGVLEISSQLQSDLGAPLPAKVILMNRVYIT